MKLTLSAFFLFCSVVVSAQVEVDKPINLNGATTGDRAITNLSPPVNDNDAANKKYVDDQIAGNSGGGHRIGEHFGGGIIVALWDLNGVETGLITALTDAQTSGGSNTMAWSGNTGSSIGPSGQSYIHGETNTPAIVAQNSTADKAATICSSYTNAETGTGVYSDWYLPASYEMTACLNTHYIVNRVLGETDGFKWEQNYWTSTEVGASDANGTMISWLSGVTLDYTQKSNARRVRCVRTF